MEANKIRCAVYTRKSTDEGLDKEFNTLEAQREAGENYIKSQRQEGWTLIADHYDDGGFSGGNMKRPALQRLVKDIEDGKVDMIVVYKIDRLTRSLLDFSKMVELFTKYNVSFVSVTQHFNTCDSMGKLTLNILLSFAQFEREVSSERIRDKFEASRKKGMWMGGSVPLGYDVKNKKLLINKAEAEIIEYIYRDYLLTRSELQTCRNVNAQGYKTKSRISKDGQRKGGVLFNHAMISNILRNPIYAGKCPYKNEVYDGLHKGIIPISLWNEVQEIKKMNRGKRFAPSRSVKNALLKGIVECECCGIMTPTRSKKGNKYYEYYTSSKAVKEGRGCCKVGSIPAAELDNFVIEKVQTVFKSPEIIQELVRQVQPQRPDIGEREVFDIVRNIDKVFKYFSPATIQNVIQQIVTKVTVGTNFIKIKFSPFGIKYIDNQLKVKENGYNTKGLEFTYKTSLRRKRGRILVLQPGVPQLAYHDEKLINAIAQAFRWKNMMDKEDINIRQLAQKEKYDRTYLGRVLRLTLLSPVIVNSILEGKQPKELKLENFTRDDIPYLWDKQLLKYGYIEPSS